VPLAHVDFLEEVRRGGSMRAHVERELSGFKCSVQELARLELAHNNCVDMLLRYFTRRWELVRIMFGDELAGPLTHDWEQERSLITTARLRLLIERRAMAATPGLSPTLTSPAVSPATNRRALPVGVAEPIELPDETPLRTVVVPLT
jgi:hypothetical protein